MFASSVLTLFLLDLFHFTASAHFIILLLNSMSTFFHHCPLSFSFLTCQTACLFSFAICLSLSPFSLSFFCATSSLFPYYFLSLHHPCISFWLICLPFSFPLYSYIQSSDLLSLSIVMLVSVIAMDIFVLIFKFASSEGKKDVMLALPAFAHSWAPGLLLFILSWSSTFIFKAECETFE